MPARSPARDDTAVVAELVRALIAEVHPHTPVGAVPLDARFAEALGLGSLELAELVARAEDAFDVSLPPETLAALDTPGDLLRAVHAAARRTPGPRRPTTARPTSPHPIEPVAVAAEPRDAATLIDALAHHVRAAPGRTHIRLLGEAGAAGAADEAGAAGELTYGELWEEATAAAAGLIERGIGRADTVALMLPTSRAYFTTFTAVLLAGAVPVPIYPPARPSQLAEHLRRHARILANAGAAVLVTVPEALPAARALRSNVDTLRHVAVPEALSQADPAAAPAPAAHAGDVALIQYTSGSTGHPKGVVLTHANLLADIRAMGRAVEASPADVFVSWLPLYHDMGLIGAWLTSLYYGMPLAVMAPSAFLTRPARWLWAVADNGGTISGGPNFAYELCLSKVADDELAGLDLRSWRVAFNGAEPVSPATVERFTARFAAYGLRPEALMPVYGLAESSVGLTFPPLGRAPVIDRVERDSFLRTGRARPTVAADGLRFVDCGQPLPGHEVRVVDAAGREAADRQEGRIEFRGPSATAGYFRNPEATRALFHGEWLDTGDLGYLADGELFVTGRVKDLVIRAGRNLHPEELEEAVGDLAGVRKGCVAVFASAERERGTERLVVVAETRLNGQEALDRLRAAVTARTVEVLGSPPDEVVLAGPGTVLKTSSGKIRRAATRERYEQGALGGRPLPAWRQVASFRVRGALHSGRRAARGAAAAVFAAYAWAAGVAVGVAAVVLLAVVPTRRLRVRSAQAGLRLLARLTATPVRVAGIERLPDGPFVAVANHASWLDGFVLFMALPDSVRMVAGEVFGQRLLSGFVLRRVDAQLVERHRVEAGASDVDRLAAAVGSRVPIAMFPEGGLSRAAGLRAFHLGAFAAAARTGAPVVPIALRGTRAMLRPGTRRPRRGAIDVVIGTPLFATGADWAAVVALQRAARAAILATCGEPDAE